MNGRTDDGISWQPFNKCFTREKIVQQAWYKVGFVPFTRNCLSDKKVRHELGQTSVKEALEGLQLQFYDLISVAERRGLNESVRCLDSSVAPTS